MAADSEPQLPDPIPGPSFCPVVFEGLMVTPWLKDVGQNRQQIAYSVRAASMTALGGRRTTRARLRKPWLSCWRRLDLIRLDRGRAAGVGGRLLRR